MFSSFVQLAISNAFYFKNYEITQNYEFTWATENLFPGSWIRNEPDF